MQRDQKLIREQIRRAVMEARRAVAARAMDYNGGGNIGSLPQKQLSVVRKNNGSNANVRAANVRAANARAANVRALAANVRARASNVRTRASNARTRAANLRALTSRSRMDMDMDMDGGRGQRLGNKYKLDAVHDRKRAFVIYVRKNPDSGVFTKVTVPTENGEHRTRYFHGTSAAVAAKKYLASVNKDWDKLENKKRRVQHENVKLVRVNVVEVTRGVRPHRNVKGKRHLVKDDANEHAKHKMYVRTFVVKRISKKTTYVRNGVKITSQYKYVVVNVPKHMKDTPAVHMFDSKKNKTLEQKQKTTGALWKAAKARGPVTVTRNGKTKKMIALDGLKL